LLILKAPFKRLVKQIIDEINPTLCVQSIALTAIQEAVEGMLVNLFEDSLLCAIHSKRVTIMTKDMRLAQLLFWQKSRFSRMLIST
jgi:histone H3